MVENIPLANRQLQGTVQVIGLCSAERGDPVYGQVLDDPAHTVPIDVFDNGYDTRLRPPFCIAFSLTPADPNNRPFLFFVDGALNPIGNIEVTASAVSFTLGGQTATFPGSYTGFQQLQLCANGTDVTLWQGCVNQVGTQPFTVPAAGGVAGSDSLSMFGSIIGNTTALFDVCYFSPHCGSTGHTGL